MFTETALIRKTKILLGLGTQGYYVSYVMICVILCKVRRAIIVKQVKIYWSFGEKSFRHSVFGSLTNAHNHFSNV